MGDIFILRSRGHYHFGATALDFMAKMDEINEGKNRGKKLSSPVFDKDLVAAVQKLAIVKAMLKELGEESEADKDTATKMVKMARILTPKIQEKLNARRASGTNCFNFLQPILDMLATVFDVSKTTGGMLVKNIRKEFTEHQAILTGEERRLAAEGGEPAAGSSPATAYRGAVQTIRNGTDAADIPKPHVSQFP